MFKWLIAFLYSLRRRRRLVLTAAAGSYALTLGSIRRHLRFGVGGGDYRLLGMTVRLTHTKRSERNLSLDAATGYLVAFGYPASLLRGLLLQITDDIPFSLIGYPVVLSKKPPVWSSTLSYTLDEGEVVEATALPVSVPGGGNPFITVSWDSSSVPSTKPDWITLTSGTTPTIAFTGGQTAADDVSSMVITATANGQSVNCTAGAVTVIATDVSWDGTESGMNVTFIQGTAGTYDLTQHVTNWDADLYAMEQTAGTDLSLAGVTLSTDGVLTYNGTAGTNIIGGVQVTIGNDAEADWLARISDPNVVWYHDFRSAAEVDQFRWSGSGYKPDGYVTWSGNDPTAIATNAQYLTFDTSDGIVPGSGCLKSTHPLGTLVPEPYLNTDCQEWWRPFSPLAAPGNGKDQDDPGAGLPIRTWAPSPGSGTTAGWTNGWYLNPANGTGDGTEFYLQVRVKMDPRRTQSSPANWDGQVGKLCYLTTTHSSASAQEIVTYSGAYVNYAIGASNYFRMYSRAYTAIEYWDSLGRPGQQLGKDGSDYGTGVYCQIGDAAKRGYCWKYSGGWDTLLYRLRPGVAGQENQLIEVWAANPGDTAYTKIWSEVYDVGGFSNTYPGGAPAPEGYNAVIFSSYVNGYAFPEFWIKYAQVIFSKAFIPLPDDPVQRGEA